MVNKIKNFLYVINIKILINFINNWIGYNLHRVNKKEGYNNNDNKCNSYRWLIWNYWKIFNRKIIGIIY
jgi:hypothetical protein